MSDFPPPPYAPPAPPPAPKPKWWKRSVPVWALIVTAVVALGLGAASGASSKKDTTKTAAAASSSSSSSEDTTTTTSTTSTTSTSTTTTLPPTTTTTTPPQPVVVGEFTGSTKTQTDSFTTISKWSITGNVSGGAGANIKIVSASGKQVDYISVDADTPLVSQFRTGCTGCYLEISPYGSTYDIIVTDEIG